MTNPVVCMRSCGLRSRARPYERTPSASARSGSPATSLAQIAASTRPSELPAGDAILFEAEAIGLDDLDAKPRIRFRHAGEEKTLACDFVAGCDGKLESLIHQRLRADIVRQSKTGKAGAAGGHRRVICEAGARVQREPCAFKFEHDAVLTLDVIVRREAEAITIEGERIAEISHS